MYNFHFRTSGGFLSMTTRNVFNVANISMSEEGRVRVRDHCTTSSLAWCWGATADAGAGGPWHTCQVTRARNGPGDAGVPHRIYSQNRRGGDSHLAAC